MSDAAQPLGSADKPSRDEGACAAPFAASADVVVSALSRLMLRSGLRDYAGGVLEELSALLGIHGDGMFLCNAQPGGLLTVQAGSGAYAEAVGKRPDELGPDLVDLVMRARRAGRAQGNGSTAYALTTTEDREADRKSTRLNSSHT